MIKDYLVMLLLSLVFLYCGAWTFTVAEFNGLGAFFVAGVILMITSVIIGALSIISIFEILEKTHA